MSATEEYKKRSAGVNAMENAGAWAIVYWTAADIHSYEHNLTDEEAEGILETANNRLKEAMTERGWDVLNEEVHQFIKERRS